MLKRRGRLLIFLIVMLFVLGSISVYAASRGGGGTTEPSTKEKWVLEIINPIGENFIKTLDCDKSTRVCDNISFKEYRGSLFHRTELTYSLTIKDTKDEEFSCSKKSAKPNSLIYDWDKNGTVAVKKVWDQITDKDKYTDEEWDKEKIASEFNGEKGAKYWYLASGVGLLVNQVCSKEWNKCFELTQYVLDGGFIDLDEEGAKKLDVKIDSLIPGNKIDIHENLYKKAALFDEAAKEIIDLGKKIETTNLKVTTAYAHMNNIFASTTKMYNQLKEDSENKYYYLSCLKLAGGNVQLSALSIKLEPETNKYKYTLKKLEEGQQVPSESTNPLIAKGTPEGKLPGTGGRGSEDTSEKEKEKTLAEKAAECLKHPIECAKKIAKRGSDGEKTEEEKKKEAEEEAKKKAKKKQQAGGGTGGTGTEGDSSAEKETKEKKTGEKKEPDETVGDEVAKVPVKRKMRSLGIRYGLISAPEFGQYDIGRYENVGTVRLTESGLSSTGGTGISLEYGGISSGDGWTFPPPNTKIETSSGSGGLSEEEAEELEPVVTDPETGELILNDNGEPITADIIENPETGELELQLSDSLNGQDAQVSLNDPETGEAVQVVNFKPSQEAKDFFADQAAAEKPASPVAKAVAGTAVAAGGIGLAGFALVKLFGMLKGLKKVEGAVV